ncbi:MAG: hypothetical protein EBR20_01010 [Bacteroidetes bacterium]|nr:hypothetical protein [Bacteroidota bacterium]
MKGCILGERLGTDVKTMYDRPQRLDVPAPAEPTPPAKTAGDSQVSTHYWDWCPRCSNRLESVKCKYVCRRCGYFMSCADFD